MESICLTCVRTDQVLDLFPGPVFTVDRRGIVIRANRHAAELFGYDDLHGVAVSDLVPEQFKSAHAGLIHQFFVQPNPRQMESGRTFYAKRRNGEVIPVDIALSMLHEGGEAYALVTVVDLTAHKAQERELYFANRAFRLVSASRHVLLRASDLPTLLNDVCVVAVDDGAYLLAWVGRKKLDAEKSVEPIASAGAKEYLRDLRVTWGDDEFGSGPTGVAMRTGRPAVVSDIRDDPASLPWREAALARGFRSGIALPLRVEGEIFGTFMLCAAQPDAFTEREIALLLEVADDLAFGIEALRHRDARAEAEATLRRLAYSDPVTGLFNRTSIVESLEAACAKGEHGALLCVDLGEFREINDAQGHLVGDALLKEVAHRLASRLSPEYTVARFNGAEFAVIAPETDGPDAARIAEHVVGMLSDPFLVNGQRFTLHAQVGITFYPDDAAGPSELYAHAALANREAAAAGRGHAFYAREMNEILTHRLEIARDLGAAIGGPALQLYYQPKVDLSTGRLTGAEALLRWVHPCHGFLSPDEFVPIAEERGLMPKLGYWVMAQACSQVVAWHDAGVPLPGRLSVNVSAKQLDIPDVTSRMLEVVRSTGCSPEAVELELTESALFSNQDCAFTAMMNMRDAGFTLAIDDFGKGYSSLSYLSSFPAEKLKIDMAFVRNMIANRKDYTIVNTIIGMADNLAIGTIAEGVETAEQATALLQLGCGEAQGYLFGVPEPAERFAEKWLSG